MFLYFQSAVILLLACRLQTGTKKLKKHAFAIRMKFSDSKLAKQTIVIQTVYI